MLILGMDYQCLRLGWIFNGLEWKELSLGMDWILIIASNGLGLLGISWDNS